MPLSFRSAAAVLAALLCGSLAYGAQATYQYAGTTSGNMTVANGSTTGTVPSGTPFTGTIVYDDAQAVAPVAAFGGTHSVFQFSQMTITMGGSTATWGPGKIDVYDNLTTNTSYPAGDSVYISMNGPQPTGLLFGAQFNWIFVALLDPTGTAITGGALPANFSSASFSTKFAEFNYGTLGTPYGAGNTSMIQFLTSFVRTGTATPPAILTTALPNGVVNVPYSAAVQWSVPNNDAVNVTVSGLPAGLSYAGGAISGTPQVAGTSSVAVTVADTVTGLSTSATFTLLISNPSIQFSPTLANGIINSAYSSSFAPATGGTGTFTYSATGLPAGLTLSGTTVSGTPTVAGTFPLIVTATDSSGIFVSAVVNLVISNPTVVTCSGTNGVISAYVARNPGFIVVNGGLNLLDHLWTSNLNAGNTTFQGGLVNWYQTGLIVDWTGTTDPLGCILTKLTVRPKVSIDTLSLPGATAGLAYSAPLTVSWGATPYQITVSGLPAGLSSNGANITGTPTVAGSFNVVITVVDGVGATVSKTLPLTVVDQPVGFAPTLPGGTVGTAYPATTLTATGFGPFQFTATGLPAGLTLSGATISGTPTTAGTFTVALTATSAAGTSASASVTVTIQPAPPGNYTIKDEGQGLITAVGSNYLQVGSKRLIWDRNTVIKVNTPNGVRTVIDSFVKVGMKVQWKGLRDNTTNTVLTQKLEVN